MHVYLTFVLVDKFQDKHGKEGKKQDETGQGQPVQRNVAHSLRIFIFLADGRGFLPDKIPDIIFPDHLKQFAEGELKWEGAVPALCHLCVLVCPQRAIVPGRKRIRKGTGEETAD